HRSQVQTGRPPLITHLLPPQFCILHDIIHAISAALLRMTPSFIRAQVVRTKPAFAATVRRERAMQKKAIFIVD
ncbi:hypothetical protein PFISCL1PPCAC_11067, partial [Pristionchus fissidentatus]